MLYVITEATIGEWGGNSDAATKIWTNFSDKSSNGLCYCFCLSYQVCAISGRDAIPVQ